VPAGQSILGSPAIPVREQRRLFMMIARLPELNRQFRELAAQVASLTGKPVVAEPTADLEKDT
jgi:UDP-3-O-[3-hydroxymyristoyl] glucosamine N-acyltransferase